MADKEPAFVLPMVGKDKKRAVTLDSAIADSNAKSFEPSFSMPTYQRPPSLTPQADAIQARAKAVLRGATLGLSDRAIAALRPGDYKTNLADEFQHRDEFAGKNPVDDIGMNVIGGLGTGGALVKGAGALGAKVAPAVASYAQGVGLGPLATRIATSLGLGAGIGETAHQAQQPYGHVGDDPGKGALLGAGAQALGSAGAKVIGMGLNTMSRVGQRVAMAIGAVRPEDFATQKYIESLAAKGLEPEEIITAMKKLRGDDLLQQGPTAPMRTIPGGTTYVHGAPPAAQTSPVGTNGPQVTAGAKPAIGFNNPNPTAVSTNVNPPASAAPGFNGFNKVTTAPKVLPSADLPDIRPPVMVADVVPKTTLNVFNKGVRSSDVATDQMDQALRDRAAEQLGRVENATAHTLSSDMGATANTEAHIKAGQVAAKPFYDAAYSVGAPADPRVLQWINDSPANAKLFRTLEDNLNQHASQGLNGSKPMSAKLSVAPDGSYQWDRYPSIEDLDTIKKYIDTQRSALWDVDKKSFVPPKLGGSTAQQLGTQRDDLVNLINQLTPDGKGGSNYATARRLFADNSDLINAHNLGQEVMRTRPEDVANEFVNLSGNPQLEDQYRAGIASVVKDIVDKHGPGGAALIKKLYGSPGIQQKIETVMANPPSNEQFGRSMAAEKAFTDTQRTLAPKVSGSDLLSDSAGFSLPLAAANTAVGRFGAAAGNLGKFATGMISDMAPGVGEELSNIALMGPEEHADWLRLYRARQNTLAQKLKSGVGSVADYVGSGVVPAGDVAAGMLQDKPQTEQNQ